MHIGQVEDMTWEGVLDKIHLIRALDLSEQVSLCLPNDIWLQVWRSSLAANGATLCMMGQESFVDFPRGLANPIWVWVVRVEVESTGMDIDLWSNVQLAAMHNLEAFVGEHPKVEYQLE